MLGSLQPHRWNLRLSIQPPELPPAPVAAEGHWQPLPSRGALFAAIGAGLTMAITLALAAGALTLVLRSPHWPLIAAAGAVIGLLWGGWFGWRRQRLTFWRLDAQALGVRRGHLWQSESRVPVSRVQHLDLRRGPLERAAGLATLTVHTAGTRLNTVAIAGLDHADAERLRDRLARQLDHDDDAL
ncbi:hypothetical protein ARC78_12275 [Stenotrophomonas pictorum JCM 9942]|uniref:YdbS-like PH domain-containing protein n=1 Tax=Stenotrophomonas pictorum JCM 9942 TaxID=1236960 RepID=A0A0R0AK73_9GAMM|nr:hypothetical protein ARC78_12275 [Stenotrophomonas pictorum JCM 9942]